MNRLATLAARIVLTGSMLCAALAGLLLIAAMEASSGLPMDLLPEVVIVRQLAQADDCGPAQRDLAVAANTRGAYQAIAAVRCTG